MSDDLNIKEQRAEAVAKAAYEAATGLKWADLAGERYEQIRIAWLREAALWLVRYDAVKVYEAL